MKKHFRLFVVPIAVFLVILASCGNISSPGSNSVPTSAPTPTQTPPPIPNVDITKATNGQQVFSPTDISITKVQGRDVDLTINNTSSADQTVFINADTESITITDSSGNAVPTTGIAETVNGKTTNYTIFAVPATGIVNVSLTKLVKTHLYLTANGFLTGHDYISELTIHPI